MVHRNTNGTPSPILLPRGIIVIVQTSMNLIHEAFIKITSNDNRNLSQLIIQSNNLITLSQLISPSR